MFNQQTAVHVLHYKVQCNEQYMDDYLRVFQNQ